MKYLKLFEDNEEYTLSDHDEWYKAEIVNFTKNEKIKIINFLKPYKFRYEESKSRSLSFIKGTYSIVIIFNSLV